MIVNKSNKAVHHNSLAPLSFQLCFITVQYNYTTFFRCLLALLHLLSPVGLVVLTLFVVLGVTDALWNLLTHGVVLSLVSQVLVEFIYFTFLYRFAETQCRDTIERVCILPVSPHCLPDWRVVALLLGNILAGLLLYSLHTNVL